MSAGSSKGPDLHCHVTPHPDISHANDTDPTHALDKTLVMRAWCFMQALNGVAPQIGRKATTGSRR